jgi:hypothetical protein
MIEFYIPHRCQGLVLGLAVQNPVEYPLFSTSPLDSDRSMPANPGLYRCAVVFPKGILMPKQYSVRLALYDSRTVYDSLPAAFSFHVAEFASLANKVPGGRTGDLQVACDWSEILSLTN